MVQVRCVSAFTCDVIKSQGQRVSKQQMCLGFHVSHRVLGANPLSKPHLPPLALSSQAG